MVTINLLPWRDQQRRIREKFFFMMLIIASTLSIMVVISIYLVIGRLNYHQKSRNHFLQRQIQWLDKKIMVIKHLKYLKHDLLSRIKIIQKLRKEAIIIVKFYEELVKITPSGVYFTSVEKKHNVYILKGVADSTVGISTLMRNVGDSTWLTRPVLIEIKTQKTENASVSKFQLSLTEVSRD